MSKVNCPKNRSDFQTRASALSEEAAKTSASFFPFPFRQKGRSPLIVTLFP